jgi:hypothetical protein
VGKLIVAEIIAHLAALETAVHGAPRRRWGKRQLAEHEDISTREVMRRVARGVYAQPEIENGRLYWWSDSYRRVSGTADSPAAKAARDPRLRKKPAQPEAP